MSSGRRALARQAITVGRGAFGIAALAYPQLIMRTLDMKPETHADSAYLTRLFGTRELALTVLSAGLGGQATARAGCRVGTVVDAVDLASLVAARRAGKVDTLPYAALLVLGAAAVGLGYLAAQA